MTAAYLLRKKGHAVTVIEKEAVLGGLASGFYGNGWEWPLERSYHHIFDNDRDILDFAGEAGYGGFVFSEPQTTSLYHHGNNYRTFTVDTPQDFLAFPLLSLPEKVRAGAVVAFLKLSPFLSLYEKETAAEFLKKTQGERVWEVLWEQLFRKKFGKYAENILASFIWARIKKRTKRLGYPEGGFQSFVNFLAEKNMAQGVEIRKGEAVRGVDRKGSGYGIVLGGGGVVASDIVISTLPTPVLLNISGKLFPASYRQRLSQIEYSHAVGFVLETETAFFPKEYWVSLCDPEAPMMVLVQHTNYVDRKHYANRHILYIGNYVTEDDGFYRAAPAAILEKHMGYLRRIVGREIPVVASHFFRMAYAQPLFTRTFPAHLPQLKTPAPGFYIANLDMTYPFDRGTNYAVKLGKEVARVI